MPRVYPPLQERFTAKVLITPSCHLWAGAKMNKGYGVFHIRKNPLKRMLAHRFAWTQTYGPIPDGMGVCHHCDVPLCVRPDHLFLGTQKDNMQDCKQKGRNSKPPLRASARLTEMQVKEIYALRFQVRSRTGLTKHALAVRYGVGKSQIKKIFSLQCWAHIYT